MTDDLQPAPLTPDASSVDPIFTPEPDTFAPEPPILPPEKESWLKKCRAGIRRLFTKKASDHTAADLETQGLAAPEDITAIPVMPEQEVAAAALESPDIEALTGNAGIPVTPEQEISPQKTGFFTKTLKRIRSLHILKPRTKTPDPPENAEDPAASTAELSWPAAAPGSLYAEAPPIIDTPSYPLAGADVWPGMNPAFPPAAIKKEGWLKRLRKKAALFYSLIAGAVLLLAFIGFGVYTVITQTNNYAQKADELGTRVVAYQALLDHGLGGDTGGFYDTLASYQKTLATYQAFGDDLAAMNTDAAYTFAFGKKEAEDLNIDNLENDAKDLQDRIGDVQAVADDIGKLDKSVQSIKKTSDNTVVDSG